MQMETQLKATILGCGTSTGVPVVGCNCRVCTSDDVRNQRTRASLMLEWNGRVVLVDTGPDLRTQCLRERVQRVDAVLYTHAHADHVHGIDDLRPFNAAADMDIDVYGSAATMHKLERSFAYAFSHSDTQEFCPQLKSHVVAEPFELFGARIVPVELEHGGGVVFGYRFGPLAYLTDCSAIPPRAGAQLQNLQVLIVDGLRFRHHPSHFTITQAIDVGRCLGARRIILTHLSHDVEYAVHSRHLPAGVELAYDGLHLNLNLNVSLGSI